jgi:hypothetical protein
MLRRDRLRTSSTDSRLLVGSAVGEDPVEEVLAGVDRITLAEVEEYGADRLLGEAEELRWQRYRPLCGQARVFIPLALPVWG